VGRCRYSAEGAGGRWGPCRWGLVSRLGAGGALPVSHLGAGAALAGCRWDGVLRVSRMVPGGPARLAAQGQWRFGCPAKGPEGRGAALREAAVRLRGRCFAPPGPCLVAQRRGVAWWPNVAALVGGPTSRPWSVARRCGLCSVGRPPRSVASVSRRPALRGCPPSRRPSPARSLMHPCPALVTVRMAARPYGSGIVRATVFLRLQGAAARG
jgi:hypothetical protein